MEPLFLKRSGQVVDGGDDGNCHKTDNEAQKYDHEGIERQLGYRPRLRIEEGFRETLDYFRSEAGKGLRDGGIQAK